MLSWHHLIRRTTYATVPATVSNIAPNPGVASSPVAAPSSGAAAVSVVSVVSVVAVSVASVVSAVPVDSVVAAGVVAGAVVISGAIAVALLSGWQTEQSSPRCVGGTTVIRCSPVRSWQLLHGGRITLPSGMWQPSQVARSGRWIRCGITSGFNSRSSVLPSGLWHI